MTTIRVIIDCGPDLCGPCHGLGAVYLHGSGKMDSPVCGIFNMDLSGAEGTHDDGMPNAYRCPECKAAEIEI